MGQHQVQGDHLNFALALTVLSAAAAFVGVHGIIMQADGGMITTVMGIVGGYGAALHWRAYREARRRQENECSR